MGNYLIVLFLVFVAMPFIPDLPLDFFKRISVVSEELLVSKNLGVRGCGFYLMKSIHI